MELLEQVKHYFLMLLSPEGFPPRWHCGSAWDSFTGWLYIVSDIGIWGAYFTIPVILTWFISKKKNMPFPRILWLFAAFIFACGLTHLVDSAMFWWPAYRLSALLYFITMVISWATVFALIPVIREALLLKTPKELEVIVQQRTADLEKSQKEMQASESRFRRIMDANIMGVVICNFDGAIIEANDAFLALIGYTRDELDAGSIDWKQLTPPEFLVLDYEKIELSHPTGTSKPYEKQYFHKNGHRVDVLVTFATLLNQTDSEDLCVALILDITTQKAAQRALELSEEQVRQLNSQLEQKVLERTAQLQAVNNQLVISNKELESFSYSVSHDLRTPLRSLDGFSKILLTDYAPLLDDKAVDYLERIRSNSQKMGMLINHLLDLSQVSRAELKRKTVNLSQLCHQIFQNYHEEDPQREVAVTIAENLIDDCDPVLIRSVLDNLLANAWKFTKHTPGAAIEFGKLPDTENPIYFVKDNGVGFDMAYSKKLFGVFQRLHTEADFTGTGIGLATVQRIIHKHNGTIRADAVLNHGATFFFTLNDSTAVTHGS